MQEARGGRGDTYMAVMTFVTAGGGLGYGILFEDAVAWP